MKNTNRYSPIYAMAIIWLDTFGSTVEFQYDPQGFPIMPDYINL